MPRGRISLFLGKGGVGRTTLASAFAVDRASAGERVLLVSVLREDDPTSRIQHEAAGVDTKGRLELMPLDSRRLVDDLVRRLTKLGPMADLILNQPGYDSLVDVVPGVREMAVFHLLAKKRDEGAYDRIVLDAPATGHGIHFLEAPQKSARILAGPLKERALALEAMLKDPEATDVVIVTLAEEMPVRETVELARTLRAQGFPLDNVAVNRWLPPVFADPDSRQVLQALSEDPEARAAFERSIDGRAPIRAEEWLRVLRLVAAQRAEAESHLAELQGLGVKLSLVPFIPETSRRLLRVAEAMRTPFAAPSPAAPGEARP